MLNVNVDCYHTTNKTATCQRPLCVGARGWPISSMVTVKIYDNGTYIGNSPHILALCKPIFKKKSSPKFLENILKLFIAVMLLY